MKNLSNRKILFIAWFGQGDFGDEAMAYALRSYLARCNVKKVKYYQAGRFPKYIGKNDIEFNSLHSFNINSWTKKIVDYIFFRSFDTVLIGGGSVLHSCHSISWKLKLVKTIAKFSGEKFFSGCVGVSIDNFKSPEIKKLCSEFLDTIDLSIFRDSSSYELAKNISSNKRLYSSLDTSLLLHNACLREKDKVTKEEGLVGIILVKNKSELRVFEKKKHFEVYLKIVNELLAQGKKITLFTFYIGDDCLDGDLNIELKNKCDMPQKVSIYVFNGDIFSVVREMSKCENIISMRLHGIIFAYILGVPFLSLGYNEKNNNFCKTINYPRNLYYNFNLVEDKNEIINSVNILNKTKKDYLKEVMPVDEATRLVKKNLDKLISGM